jgi:peroxiredoxin
MSHGVHSAADWNRVIEEIHGMIAAEEQNGDTEAMIDITLILSQVYSDLLGQHERADAILREMKSYVAEHPTPGVTKLYVRLTEVNARLGKERAINSLIDEFMNGPHYDPQPYTVEGGEAPGVPVRIMRPHAMGDASVTVTAMQRASRESRFAPGKPFPPLRAVDDHGQQISTAGLRGSVVLVDFWHPQWTAWKRDLGTLQSVYRDYAGAGLEVIGVPLEKDRDALHAYMEKYGVTWPQLQATQDIMNRCGVAGEAANFLIDKEGRILGRNLYGDNLRFSVEQALAP